MRNPLKKPEEQPNPEVPQAQPVEQEPKVQIMEREINLSLINDKLNYLTGIVLRLAEAAEIELKE